jgi:UDP-N-acetylmuramate dehydrogenase
MAGLLESGLVAEHVPLGPMTTYKSGGPARYFARPSKLSDLAALAEGVGGEDILVLGRGSNLVVADKGFDGLVVHVAQGFGDVAFDGLEITAGAGSPLPLLARKSVEAGIAGLEFFVGVPGSVGGAVRQNAGCFGVEAKDRLVVARIFDLAGGDEFEATPEDLDMSYRNSLVQPSWVVTSARFRGTSDDTANSKAELKEITRWRKENQPGGTLNAGSVFKNPPGTTAGALIDTAGLKGYAVGAVSVSEKHANFFVATREATSAQIRDLVFSVQSLVEERAGVMLEPELQMVGFDD